MLICLDDLQWADAGTAEALRVLPARLGGVPVIWIIAYRTAQAPALLLRSVAELSEANATRLVLDPLDEDSVGQVIADLMNAPAGPALLEIADNAHGVPFLLIELLRGLLEEGLVRIDRAQAVLVEARLPSRVGDSMRERLDRVPAPARRAAVAASVLGRSFRFDDLAAMLGTAPAALLEPVEELIRAEILAGSGENLGFRHDIIRQAVLDSVPAAARRALDRQAAGILLAAGAVPLEIASRLAASAEPGDEVAIATLHEAARAIAPGDPGMASEFARKALALTADADPRRAALAAETAVFLHAAGRDMEAREFATAALGRVLPPEAEAQVRLSIAQMYSLPADSRIESGRAALALPGVSPVLRARHLAVMVLSLVAAAKPEEARAAVAGAEAAARSTNNASARLNLEFGRLALDEASFEYASMMPRIQAIRRLGAEAGEDAQVQAAEWFRSSLLAAVDRLDEALEVAHMGLAAAQRDHQAWIAPRWEIWRGWLLLQQGHISDAGAALEGAFAAEGIALAWLSPMLPGWLPLARWRFTPATRDYPKSAPRSPGRRLPSKRSTMLAATSCGCSRFRRWREATPPRPETSFARAVTSRPGQSLRCWHGRSAPSRIWSGWRSPRMTARWPTLRSATQNSAPAATLMLLPSPPPLRTPADCTMTIQTICWPPSNCSTAERAPSLWPPHWRTLAAHTLPGRGTSRASPPGDGRSSCT